MAGRGEGQHVSHVHFSRLALSGRKGSSWHGGVAPVSALNLALILLTEPRMCDGQWAGQMCAMLNQPWLGQGPKLSKVEGNLGAFYSFWCSESKAQGMQIWE